MKKKKLKLTKEENDEEEENLSRELSSPFIFSMFSPLAEVVTSLP